MHGLPVGGRWGVKLEIKEGWEPERREIKGSHRLIKNECCQWDYGTV
jgi:hypothetical protein